MLTKQSQFLTILQAWLDGVCMKALLEPIVLLKTRIIDNLPSNCYAKIYKVIVDGKPVPDIKKNYHQPLLNA